MKNFSSIIFDLDGTLIDSIPDIANSMNKVLVQYGLPQHTCEQYKYFVGRGIKNLVEKSVPEGYNGDLESIFNSMMMEYAPNSTNQTTIYDGIPELLDYLSLNNVKMAILSNKADSITQKICHATFSRWKFEVIMGATDDFPRKPNPESALFIAETMNVKPSDLFYLGDTNIDMQTANAAGFFSVGATWGFRTKQELIDANAMLIVEKPSECMRFFV